MGSDRVPSFATMRSRPGRSVTSMRPSGRKARPQGNWSFFATVSTLMGPDLVSIKVSLAKPIRHPPIADTPTITRRAKAKLQNKALSMLRTAI